MAQGQYKGRERAMTYREHEGGQSVIPQPMEKQGKEKPLELGIYMNNRGWQGQWANGKRKTEVINIVLQRTVGETFLLHPEQ